MTSHKTAFTWTELLVLIAILGFLAAVLVPTMDRGRRGHRRSIDASNIRQIGQASLIYANDHREQLPGLSLNQAGEIEEGSTTPNIHALAAALARGGGLNDGSIWISSHDTHPDVNRKNMTVVLESGLPRIISPEFARSTLSFQYIGGLETKLPSTTPIAFTRGLQPDGNWASDKKTSVRGSRGGHVVFMGGNISYYKNLHDGGGVLTSPKRVRTANVLETIDSSARIFSDPPTLTGAFDGMPGVAP